MRLKLSLEEIREGLDILLENGHLSLHEDGRFLETHRLVSTGDRVNSVLALQHLSRMIEESLAPLEELPATEREYGTLTLGLDEAQFQKLKELTRRFRKDALSLAGAVPQVDRVIQVNVQVFPLTQSSSRSCT